MKNKTGDVLDLAPEYPIDGLGRGENLVVVGARLDGQGHVIICRDNLLKLFPETALQRLCILVEQDQLEVVHQGGRIAPALCALSETEGRVAGLDGTAYLHGLDKQGNV